MMKYILISVSILILCSCEQVIKVDLNDADPAFVVEAIIYKDSVAVVRLTRTASYFSLEESEFIGNATINISDGNSSEELSYSGNGYYTGHTIIGTEGRTYQLEITYGGKIYTGRSYMPKGTHIISVDYVKDESVSIFNPDGKTMFTIKTDFIDDPDKDNFYMVRFFLNGEILKDSYYVLTEKNAVNGSLDISNINSSDNDTIRFSEWMFYNGGGAEVQVFSIDESVYNYFLQLNDILYWKRRFMPPNPYNPKSNISNGALGYFAAWSYDSRKIQLE